MDDQRHDVFLSHSSADKPAVETLARRLIAIGIQPWLDTWNLIPGEPWQEAIEHALGHCAACAVFIGPSGAGPWQNEQMRVAIARRVDERSSGFRVIPVLLPGAERGERSSLPNFLLTTTWVEFRTTLDDERAFHLLTAGIHGIAPGPDPDSAVYQGITPYRGLQVFDIADWPFFFGREALTEWLVNTLRPTPGSRSENRFLGIIGPSGSGKSSLARAGLAAALSRGAISGSQEWPITAFKPGVDPLESLAIALAGTTEGGQNPQSALALIGALRDSERALHLAVRLGLRDTPPTRRLVLLIDQFEEVFTLCHDDQIRRALIDNLLYAANVAQGQTAVLLTLRADFYGQCAAYPTLAAALSDHQMLVGPMTTAELQQAIERPALLAGCEFEPGLVDTLIDDVQGQPGALPLLQHALLELWNRRSGRRLTHAAYQAIGGVEGALEQRAEAIYGGFSTTEQAMCQRIFLRLTQPGEGTEDTRRRASLQELLPSGAESNTLDDVVQTLASADARLVITEGNHDHAEEQYVEVAHEALIRSWPRLRGWIDQNRAALRTQRRLTEASHEWESNQRDPSYLYQGARLAVAQEWAMAHKDDLNDLERAYLDASGAANLAARRHAQQRTRLTVGGLVLALALISGFLALVLVQNRRIADAARVDRGRLLVEQGQSIWEDNPLLGLRLALEGLMVVSPDDAEIQKSFVGTIEAMSKAGRLLKLKDEIGGIFPNQDGSLLILNHNQNQSPAELRRTADSKLIATLSGRVAAVNFSPDTQSTLFLVRYDDSKLPLELRRSSDGAVVPLSSKIDRVYFSPRDTSNFFVVSYQDETPAELRRLTDGTRITTLLGRVLDATFSPDAAVSYFTIEYADKQTSAELRRSSDGMLIATLSAFSGTTLFSDDSAATYLIFASSQPDIPSQLRRSADGVVIATLPGAIYAEFSHDPTATFFRVCYPQYGQNCNLYRSTNGEQVSLSGSINYVIFSQGSSEGYFAVHYQDLKLPVELRRCSDGSLITTLTSATVQVAFSSDPAATYFTALDADHSGHVPSENLQRGELHFSADGTVVPLSAPIAQVTFSPDPNAAYFVVEYADTSKPAELRRTSDAGLVSELPGNGGEAFYSPDPDAKYLIWIEKYHTGDGTGYPPPVLGTDGLTTELRRTSDGSVITTLSGFVDNIRFSPDPAATMLVTHQPAPNTQEYDRTVAIHLSADGTLVAHSDFAKEVSFLPDPASPIFLVQYEGERIELWDRQGSPAPHRIVDLGLGLSQLIDSRRQAIVVDPQNRRAVSEYTDGRAYLLDVDWLRALANLPQTGSTQERASQLAQLACQGPLASGLFDTAELKPYLGDQPAQACR